MSFMLDEIRQQPDVIAEMASRGDGAMRALAEEIRKRDVAVIILVARGTSDNAAVFGKYLLELVHGIPCALAAPSIVTLYGARLDFNRSLVISISQSGKATDVVEYVRAARNGGALTAAITNEEGSELAEAAEHALFFRAGVERSVAATKTYTATLGALYTLAAEMSGREDILQGLRQASDLMKKTLAVEERIAEIAERYRYMEECFVISRGLNQATAAETALKMAETSYVGAESYSAADFMHGPIAVVDEGFPCFLLAPSGKAFQALNETADKLWEKRSELVVVARDESILSKAVRAVPIPVEVDELFSPLVYTIAGQLLAYHIAAAKGYDPDRPRGLSKVTLTR